jgi:hypothetical protein
MPINANCELLCLRNNGCSGILRPIKDHTKRLSCDGTFYMRLFQKNCRVEFEPNSLERSSSHQQLMYYFFLICIKALCRFSKVLAGFESCFV